MPRIKVLTPFGLRLNSDTPKREFARGKVYTLSAEEYGHWFIKGCLAEGRAIEIAENSAKENGENDEQGADMPTIAELLKLKLDDLKEFATACKIDVPEKATKEQLATALVEGPFNGCYVVKTANGFAIAEEM